MNFRELEHVLRPVAVSCTLTLKKPTQVLSPITRNRTTNQCIGQNRMIETNHQTKIEDCRTVTILSLREIFLKKTCFKFNNYGYCKFGDKCSYAHFEQSHNQQHNQQVHYFLAEMRVPVSSVKDMIESQKHVDLQLPSQGFFHRLRNLTNTWVRDLRFFQVQCGTRWI